jgi:succinate dehydrogenase (ubiquinone) membrane anchor subunit
MTYPQLNCAVSLSDNACRSAITDYFPKWRVPKIRKLADWANVAAVFIVGWGWYEFETNDIGLTAGLKRVWTAGATAKEAGKEVEKLV